MCLGLMIEPDLPHFGTPGEVLDLARPQPGKDVEITLTNGGSRISPQVFGDSADRRSDTAIWVLPVFRRRNNDGDSAVLPPGPFRIRRRNVEAPALFLFPSPGTMRSSQRLPSFAPAALQMLHDRGKTSRLASLPNMQSMWP